MDIDFSKKEEREGYLQTKLDDLLDGINASYGQSLLDELMGSLKKSSEEKEKLIQQIKSGEKIKSDSKSEALQDDTISKEDETDEEPRELSEWEKKLEGIS